MLDDPVVDASRRPRVAAVAAPLGPGFRRDDDNPGKELTLLAIKSVIALQLPRR